MFPFFIHFSISFFVFVFVFFFFWGQVPADFRVISCSDDFEVDNASLTGESEPQTRKSVCTDTNPLETKNLCFFGTFVSKGSCTGVVLFTGDDTAMGRIAKLSTSQKADKTPLAIEIDHFVHVGGSWDFFFFIIIFFFLLNKYFEFSVCTVKNVGYAVVKHI